MACHQTVRAGSPTIAKLRQFHESGTSIPWVRVYRLPEFVFFSHAKHLNGGARCADCHGQVEERDVVAKEVSTSMITCMNCHAERRVRVDCSVCHQLGQ